MRNNIPAFPSRKIIESLMGAPMKWETYDGMTLRDYFAGMALSESMRQVMDNCERHNQWPEDWRHGIVADAYLIADAMLAEREARSKT